MVFLATAFITYLLGIGFQSFPVLATTDQKSSTGSDIFKGRTKIANPLQLRDPFKRIGREERKSISEKKGILKNGVFTNIPSPENIPLDKLQLIGVLVGEKRRAMARVPGGHIIVLKEGMILGLENAELKAILPGGIVLVEKIINIYGQEEYLETVIPIGKGKK